MDKRVNKMVPFVFELKTASFSGYFIILSFTLAFIYNLVIMGGSSGKYISLQVSVFLLSVVGILVWILPAYLEMVNPESKELILSLPIEGFSFVFLRTLRLYLFYMVFDLALFTIIYNISDKSLIKMSQLLEFDFLQGILISGSLFFLSGVGLLSLFVTRQGIIGFCVPILWTMVSFFFRGGGLWLLHPCEWVQPNPGQSMLTITIALWIFGLIFHLLAVAIVKKREYLIK